MNYEVIFFAPNGGIGHQLFATFDEAVAFERTMLAKDYSTSGVLGSDGTDAVYADIDYPALHDAHVTDYVWTLPF